MKVVNERNEVVSSGEIAQSNFSVENNAKIFRMLSEQVYSDPILAVVREYTCNAWDANKMAGREKEPVTIHLPTVLEPHWAVRDNGPGLSQAQIMGSAANGYKGLFNTYGKSGKDDSDAFIGGFGVGSKAGFAYTKQDSAFTVTSWHDGVKHCFTAHMDANGIPSITMMYCEASNEPSGLEISIPVKTKDIETFVQRTNTVCRYFSVWPKFTGVDLAKEEAKPYVQEGTGWRRKEFGRYCGGKSVAIIGGIGYPIDAYQFEGVAAAACNSGFEIDIPIGAVELSLSRESLSYDNRTLDYLNTRLNKIADDVNALYTQKLSSAKTMWDKAVLYRSFKDDPLVSGSTVTFTHKGRKVKDYFAVDYHELTGVQLSSIQARTLERASQLRYTESIGIYAASNLHVVWNDTSSKRLLPKINRLKTMVHPDATLVFIKTASRTLFRKAWAKLGGCPNVIHLNKLEDLHIDTGDSTPGVKRDKDDLTRKVRKLYDGYSASTRGYYRETTLDFATADTVYYVWVKGQSLYRTADCEGYGLRPNNVTRALRNASENGILDVWNKHAIYAISSIYECHVEGKDNFINVLDLFNSIEVPGEVVKEAEGYDPDYYSRIFSFRSNLHRHLTGCKLYNKTKLFSLIEELPRDKESMPNYKAVRTINNYNNIFRLINKPDVVVQYKEEKNKIDFSAYPMLQTVKESYSLRSEHAEIISQYIKECEEKNVSI